MKQRALIAHNRMSDRPAPDEADVLVQIDAVKSALVHLGYEVETAGVSLDLSAMRDYLRNRSPDLVFNLVESLDGEDRFAPAAAIVFESLQIPFTGSSSSSLLLTSDKCSAKKIMRAAAIPTPEWLRIDRSLDVCPHYWPCIVKSSTDHASIGISDASVIANEDAWESYVNDNADVRNGSFFAEEYVDGREFNVSLLADGCGGAEVLPVAEIVFEDFPEGKPRIVGYAAKWHEDTFEYQHTCRVFTDDDFSRELHAGLGVMAKKCFSLFSLKGYARVDFRLDKKGNPKVLEINANPCLSPDAGFFAACAKAGIDYPEMIRRICASAVTGS